jgi:hypothetical protein
MSSRGSATSARPGALGSANHESGRGSWTGRRMLSCELVTGSLPNGHRRETTAYETFVRVRPRPIKEGRTR